MEIIGANVIRAVGGGRLDAWAFKPSVGASGGILSCWDSSRWTLVDKKVGLYSLSVLLVDPAARQWIVSNVYGPHEASHREGMWEELSAVRAGWDAPWCILGDFNITRFSEDRNTEVGVLQDMEWFNEWIDQEGQLDLPLANLAFTWSNMRGTPSLAKLDRFLICSDWEEAVPDCGVIGLPRSTSDHVPLLLRSIEQPRSSHFKFESWWCEYPELEDIVRRSWTSSASGLRGARRMVFKLKRLKNVLKSWSRKQRKDRDMAKEEWHNKIAEIDKIEERRVLTEMEREVRRQAKTRFAEILNMEEREWRQKSNALWLKEGDGNTKFFHKVANQRRRQNQINQITVEGRTLHDRLNIETGIVNHFQKVFKKKRGWRPKWEDRELPQIHQEDRVFLDRPFSEEEIFKVVKATKGEKSPGPDGFGLIFYKRFWDIVKEDIILMLEDFRLGRQGIGCINACTFILIPKKEAAEAIADYRPICLVNGCYMILAKVLTNRLKKVCPYIIEENQSAFIPGRGLQEGYAISQEIIANLHKDKRSGVILKMDFAKAYDNVVWDFLLQVMALHGFSSNWLRMIRLCIGSANASVNINGSVCGFFPINRGLRQGDPLSPLLFSIVANVLSRMCLKAERARWIVGLPCTNGGTPITHLQYADDTMMFAEPEVDVLGGYKFILSCFSLLSGLSINWSKSALCAIHVESTRAESLAALLGCELQQAAPKHLGLPLVQSRLLRKDWTPLVERVEKRLAGWQNRCLSSAGKLVLLQAVLSNLPTFYLSIFRIPQTVLKKIDVIRRRFFWNGAGRGAIKPHLVQWTHITQPKASGGLGVLDLEFMNKALLAKWLWRWALHPNSLWVRLFKERYGTGASLFPPASPAMSFLCKGWFKLAGDFSLALRWKLGSGQRVPFWEACWCSNRPLRVLFPRLYCLAENRLCKVVECWSDRDWALHLRRITSEEEVVETANLTLLLQAATPRPNTEDSLVWGGENPEAYSVKEGYAWWQRDTPNVPQMVSRTKWIWQCKMPLKVKIFLWQAFQGRILTKATRAIWRPTMSTECELCKRCVETAEHLLCQCSALLPLWSLVERASGTPTSFMNEEELWGRMRGGASPGSASVHVRRRGFSDRPGLELAYHGGGSTPKGGSMKWCGFGHHDS
ncbi:hypothetical protein QJS04_geneDACA020812 [Acorus gramineus]|uniref:Reverse transcriptase domain-containing protein n=1 Tax=Acorus gramineus TaxID=55184 RepID=A0AAV9BIG1_ACOGR|nr:hypothetical protein QJS04_geneDACA020812 [Acorus gramineus]